MKYRIIKIVKVDDVLDISILRIVKYKNFFNVNIYSIIVYILYRDC